MRLLQSGSAGPDVRTAQAALNFHAEPGNVTLVEDGRFGRNSHNRVVQFQKFHSLVPDGKIGAKTRSRLYAIRTTYVALAVTDTPSPYNRKIPAQRPSLIDWSKMEWRFTPRLHFSPAGTPLTLPTLVTPGTGFQPVPRMLWNLPLHQGQTKVRLPPARANPVKFTLMSFSILPKGRLSLSNDLSIKPVLEKDGTLKIQGVATSRLGILEGDALSFSVFHKAQADGKLTPVGVTNKSVSGLTLKYKWGKLEISCEQKLMEFDPRKEEVTFSPLMTGGSLNFAGTSLKVSGKF